jgi:Glu-tRNA(Gln) amidotransferase subunit E-like FAD-binding protein
MALNYRVFEYTNFNSSTFNVALKIHSVTNLWCWCTAHVVDNSVPSVYCLHVDRSSLSTRDKAGKEKDTRRRKECRVPSSSPASSAHGITINPPSDNQNQTFEIAVSVLFSGSKLNQQTCTVSVVSL